MYPTEFVPDPEVTKAPPVDYGRALKEIATSSADLFHKEMMLMRAEFVESIKRVREHTIEVAIFGGLCALSLYPLTFALIIGLSRLMRVPVWISSLSVGLVFAAVGSFFAARAYRRLKRGDISFSRSRISMERASRSMQAQMEKVKHAIKGDRYGSAH